MPLTFALADLVRATLPQGLGWVGLVGVDPQGQRYHVLAPVAVEQAWDLLGLGLGGPAVAAGRRPGWRYHLCRNYPTPPPRQGRPPAMAFVSARRDQALHNGRALVAWAGRQGWWARLETGPPGGPLGLPLA